MGSFFPSHGDAPASSHVLGTTGRGAMEGLWHWLPRATGEAGDKSSSAGLETCRETVFFFLLSSTSKYMHPDMTSL